MAKGAARYILENKPNLCFIHFTDPDDAGHKYGWGSPQQIKAFSEVDAALAEIVKAIEAAGISDESVLIITADHGGHGKTHGGKTPEDMLIPWIAWGKNVKRDFTITETRDDLRYGRHRALAAGCAGSQSVRRQTGDQRLYQPRGANGQG